MRNVYTKHWPIVLPQRADDAFQIAVDRVLSVPALTEHVGPAGAFKV